MSYDLSRFSTQSFERFVQAIAVAQLGPGTQIYGAGPDGAREATFEGECRAAPSAAPWNGYVVVQAKYNAAQLSGEDGLEWLKREADKELKKFESAKRKLRKPNYYILATNVKLTPGAANADGKGGGTLDKMLEHLKTWSSIIGVTEVFLWHGDMLLSLIDVYSGIRQTFAAWTMPGDVLTLLAKSFSAPSFDETMGRALKKEIFQQRGLKTRDSGQAHDKQIYIDEVFVDLPLTQFSLIVYRDQFPDSDEEILDSETDLDAAFERIGDDNDDGDDDDDIEDDAEDEYDVDDIDIDFDELNTSSEYRNVVRNILFKLSDKLDNATSNGKIYTSPYQRIVILGGPGQGKSTIGQFISQLLRARLIARSGSAPPEILNIANDTIARAAAEGLPLDGPMRFPIHVQLPRYADTLSRRREDPPSLLKFIAEGFSRVADETVSVSTMRDWLKCYPSLIVLDGLDEVPRTGNRADVLNEINLLIADVHESNADTLVLVTSRPQGYANDLDGKHWRHWKLEELNPSNAIRFASRLGAVLLSEEQRRDEVLAIIKTAAAEPSTASLMISPLQVSLLFSLVMTRNDIPNDRWTLFEKHYEALRDREIAKGDATGEMIKKYRSEIDLIHYDAGFILQVRAETSGNASAYFTPSEFKMLIERHIRASITNDDEVKVAVRDLLWVSTTRLVFLGDRNEDRVSFDVRSLQEFMAAARIMVSPEPKITERLSEIALKSHWLHVFRIACSKVYALPSLVGFRQDICTILDQMDSGDVGSEYKEVRAGARLAISLLKDSTAGARQSDRVQLMVRALKALEIDSPDLMIALAQSAAADTAQPFSRAIAEHLATGAGTACTNALRVAFTIARDIDHPLNAWAQAELLSAASANSTTFAGLSEMSLAPQQQREVTDFLLAMMWAAGPGALRRWPKIVAAPNNTPVLIVPAEAWSQREYTADIRDHSGGVVDGVSLVFKPLDSLADLDVPAWEGARAPEWLFVDAAIKFSRSPSPEALAAAVDVAASCRLGQLPASDYPWLLSACLHALTGGRTAASLAAGIREGEYGDQAQWIDAEKRWSNAGVTIHELALPQGPQADIRSLSIRGAPPIRSIRRHSDNDDLPSIFIANDALWSPEDKLLIFPIVAWLVRTEQAALEVCRWAADNILTLDWHPNTSRRAAALLHKIRSNFWENEFVIALANKVSTNIPIDTRQSIPFQPLFANLSVKGNQRWAANLLSCGLPNIRGRLTSAIEDDSAAVLSTPKGSSTRDGLSFFLLRAATGIATETELKKWTKIIVEQYAQYSPSILKRLYRGEREGAATESFVSAVAEGVLSSGYKDSRSLLDILMQVMSSRESCFNLAASLDQLQLPHDVRPEPARQRA